MKPRNAKAIIDQAIRENRIGEYLLYSFAAMFVVVGLSVLVWGIVDGEPIIAGAGSVSSILFWPAMSSARRTRKENIAIRLLEAALDGVGTGKEAAGVIGRVVGEVLGDKRKDG